MPVRMLFIAPTLSQKCILHKAGLPLPSLCNYGPNLVRKIFPHVNHGQIAGMNHVHRKTAYVCEYFRSRDKMHVWH